MRLVLAGVAGCWFVAAACSGVRESAAVSHCEAGKRALGERDFRIAMNEAEAALALDPRLGDAHRLRAAVLTERTEFAKALSEYTAAVRLNPRDASSYYDIGVLRHDSGDLDRAIKAYDRAIAIRPSAAAYNSRGCARYELRDAGARHDFERALELDPANEHANVNLAHLDIEASAYDAAIERLTRVLGRDAENPEALDLRARAYEASGRKAEAAQDRMAIQNLRSRGAR